MLASMQTSELTAYVLTLTLLSSERRRRSHSRSRRGHLRPLLLLRGGGKRGDGGGVGYVPPASVEVDGGAIVRAVVSAGVDADVGADGVRADADAVVVGASPS